MLRVRVVRVVRSASVIEARGEVRGIVRGVVMVEVASRREEAAVDGTDEAGARPKMSSEDGHFLIGGPLLGSTFYPRVCFEFFTAKPPRTDRGSCARCDRCR